MMLSIKEILVIWLLYNSPGSSDYDVDKGDFLNYLYGLCSNFYHYNQEYTPKTLDFTFSIEKFTCARTFLI